MLLTAREYEAIRSVPNHSLNARDHDDPSIERVVERHERYDVSQKFGAAGRVVYDADPRS